MVRFINVKKARTIERKSKMSDDCELENYAGGSFSVRLKKLEKNLHSNIHLQID